MSPDRSCFTDMMLSYISQANGLYKWDPADVDLKPSLSLTIMSTSTFVPLQPADVEVSMRAALNLIHLIHVS